MNKPLVFQILVTIALVAGAIITGILIISCEKDNTGNPVHPEPGYDSIVSMVFNPSIAFCSADTNVPSPPYVIPTYIHPVPWDSSTSMNFDVTGDGQDDIKFTSTHDYYEQGGPHYFYWNRHLRITGVNDSTFIASDVQTAAPVHIFNSGDTINSYLNWKGYCNLFAAYYGALQYVDFKGECLIGIKIGIKKPVYGWIKVNKNDNGYCCNWCDNKLEILSYAMNMGTSAYIVAGNSQ